ncbi:mycothione reductase [Mycobacterium kansasii]|uniref:Mycothione reductase n=1 Tax=Mycobacterium kansasii TaxID=1768 RepID=A0A1V3XT07_MYCKA|nr:mycothione reductase [Mycobacterium kansasii]
METYDLAIIGTGSGNSILDDRYAHKRVAICEQGTFGGTCLNVGCLPTKMFVYAADVAKTIRGANRYGVDAHIDGVRWDDIVSRVFGRIDPIAMGGEQYRRSARNIDVYPAHTRFGGVQADGSYLLRTDGGDEFTADQVVIAAGSRPVIPPAILACGVRYHTSDTVMRIAELPKHLVIVGSGFVAAEFAHVFSAFGVRVTLVIRAAVCCGIATTRCANGSPASRRPSGNCAPIAMSWPGKRRNRPVAHARRRVHHRRGSAAGGDRPEVQRRPVGRRPGRRRRGRRPGGSRRIPKDFRA